MSVLIIEEKPPHFTDVEFEYKGIEFKAQICLLDTGKVMISFRVPKNELEQNLCKGLLNSRGTKLDIKINHLPMCANVDTCSFAILKKVKKYRSKRQTKRICHHDCSKCSTLQKY